MPVLGNEGYTTVGNPTLGVTSILTKLRWGGGVIRVMPLIRVWYYRSQAMILQAKGHDSVTTDHYTTSPPVRTYTNVTKGCTKGRTLGYKRPLQKNVR